MTPKQEAYEKIKIYCCKESDDYIEELKADKAELIEFLEQICNANGLDIKDTFLNKYKDK